MPRYLPYLIIFIAAILLLHLLSYRSPQFEHHRSIQRSVRVSQDSARVTIDRTSPGLRVTGKLRASKKRLALDTVIAQDTLRVCVYDDSTIAIALLPSPRIVTQWVKYLRTDSIVTTRDTLIRMIPEPWYRSPLLVLAGAVLGLMLGVLL
jgi:uncharacterized membrane protein